MGLRFQGNVVITENEDETFFIVYFSDSFVLKTLEK